MAQLVGLNEEEYAVLTELELASFSVLLHCRRLVSFSKMNDGSPLRLRLDVSRLSSSIRKNTTSNL